MLKRLVEAHTFDPAQRAKVRLFTEFLEAAPSPDVPNPWNGAPVAYEHVFELIERGCKGLKSAVEANHAR